MGVVLRFRSSRSSQVRGPVSNESTVLLRVSTCNDEDDVEADPEAEDPETMGGRLRKIFFRCRGTVCSPCMSHEVVSQSWQRQDVDEAAWCTVRAHADPDSVWTSFWSPLSSFHLACELRRSLQNFYSDPLTTTNASSLRGSPM